MWGYFFLINGLSLLFMLSLDSESVKNFLMENLISLLILFSFPHFMVTYWIWFKRVQDWRREWLPIIFPILYVAFFLSIFYFKPTFIDISTLIKLSYCYLLYHFAQQLYGSNLWLNHSLKVSFSNFEKYGFRALALMSAFYALTMLEMSGAASSLFYHRAAHWNFSASFISGLFYVVLVLFLILTSLRIKNFMKNRELKELYPFMGYIICFIWFFPPSLHGLALFLPIVHALQYSPFVFMKLKDSTKIKLAATFAISISAGYFFFRWIPFQDLGEALPTTIWAPLVLTTLNNHHFVIDGRIWKLGDPQNKDLRIKI